MHIIRAIIALLLLSVPVAAQQLPQIRSGSVLCNPSAKQATATDCTVTQYFNRAFGVVNNGALITSGTGVPSISTTLPAAVQGNITALGTIVSGVWTGTTIALANGGTGATTAAGARTALGLGALATVTPGTGVATALAVNVGTVGSFVVTLQGYVNVAAVCDGVTDDTAVIQAAIDAGAGTLYFPRGTCMSGPLTGASNQKWQGTGRGATILKLNSNPTLFQSFIDVTSKTNFQIRDLTLDWNNKLTVSTSFGAALALVNTTDCLVSGLSIINYIKFGITLNGVQRCVIEDNFIDRTTLDLDLTECIFATGSPTVSSFMRIKGNYCANAGIGDALTYSIITENVVNGFGYGAGIAAAPGTSYNIIANNFVLNGSIELDTSAVRAPAFELYNALSVTVGNIASRNGGDGIHTGGKYNVVSSNVSESNGLRPGIGAAGFVARAVDGTTNSEKSVWTGNIAIPIILDSQPYGFNAIPTAGAVYPNYTFIAGGFYGGGSAGQPISMGTGLYRSSATTFLEESQTYNPPSMPNGSRTTATMSVPGAAVQDRVEVSFSLDTQGVKFIAAVTASTVVTVILENNTGATIDLASGTLRAVVMKNSTAGNF